MSAIQIISASAGSGKTFRLAKLLEKEVGDGRVRPDAIVATTFTNKAAAELAERVRLFLLKAGRTEDAERLAASRMGTVNSVCSRLVSDFAFELGLSPRLEVLDERRADMALARAFTAAAGAAAEIDELVRLERRLGELGWEARVQEIVREARNNGIEGGALPGLAEESFRELGELLDRPKGTIQKADRALLRALERFVRDVDLDEDTTKGTAEFVADVQRVIARLKTGRRLAWADWLRLCNSGPRKKSAGAWAKAQKVTARVLEHPGLHEDLSRATELVFSLAARVLGSYAEYKRARGLIDFVDQEVLALDLLGRAEVQARLRQEIDLVLVDEFQDTSPLQLAIFLSLGKLAAQNVWVGDQKQSIYGFRGTDPALMDAAIDRILRKRKPETLPHSWRSRPALVDVTSDVFAESFGRYGFPKDRVKLTPRRQDAKGLGGCVAEVWQLESRNRTKDAAAVAAGVRQLLGDASVKVQDRRDRSVRRARASDVAVLCRSNDQCAKIAGFLAQLGIRSVLSRSGLVGTAHGWLAVAGLRLWADPRDSLAASEIARIVDHPDEPEAWLNQQIAKPGLAASSKRPWFRQLMHAREAQAGAGAVAAMDSVTQALELRERFLRWPDGTTRLADLDALRAHVVAYQQLCDAEGVASTAAGAVAYLQERGETGEDARAVVQQGDAVVLSTWHRAKGLEWPIVVLADLHFNLWPTPLGRVMVVSGEAQIDLDAPLRGRRIRYWPDPWPNFSRSEFHERLWDHPATVAGLDVHAQQEMRVMYVGWTRARDRLVLTSRTGALSSSAMVAQLTRGDERLIHDPEVGDGKLPAMVSTAWAGTPMQVLVRQAVPVEDAEAKPEPGTGYDSPVELPEHPPAWAFPSEEGLSGKVGRVDDIGTRLKVGEVSDWAAFGSALHDFFAADQPGLTEKIRAELCQGLLERWDVAGGISVESVLQASRALRRWVEKRWPGAKWRNEWSLLWRHGGGSAMFGRADLILETDDGVVIIDHKCFPGDQDTAVEVAVSHVAQLDAYAGAVTAATSKRLLGTFIHLPVSGIAVEVKCVRS